ncbi:probable serine/threonine-protein kinase PBL10, partial [Phragmites australis]|uniref:probable serine/threonine-protein kinase PBL10 n=1 Tax=Phragmites australis TaxID=29695 RepID=UPI002D777796
HGVLEDRSLVAVKRFIHDVKENFAKELTVHCEINHKNVVRLIGYCLEENALMMVTEYIPNGNLSDVLHHDNSHIPLDLRLRIATQCAEALGYMHSSMYTKVIHGDIKPDNILLDGSFNAKISDFGISRLVNTDTTVYTKNVKGSIGYMDPLFARDGRLTVKSDVYSFGVVLLELITRRKATTKDGKAIISDLCTDALSRGIRGLKEMFDAKIACQNNMKIIEGVAKLAFECLRMERDKRPDMIDVAMRLRTLTKALQQGQQRVDLFSWVWKSKPSPPALVTVPTTPSPPALVTTPTKTLSSAWCRQFTFAEMEAATKQFDKSLLVGDDDFGKVYCGGIDGGALKVAIKRLGYTHGDGNFSEDSQGDGNFSEDSDAYGDGRRRFRAETRMRSTLCHRHLVPLIGYCDEKDEFIVVYDYMSRGSLREHLYKTQNPPLTWKHRLEICIGAARGLHYLHTVVKPAIIHCSVKLTNILLDEECVAKISHNIESDPETETRRCSYVNAGDPERDYGGRLTEKSDVYSFGAVLFEVLCARPILDTSRPIEQVHLLCWASCCKDEGNLDQIVDPYLKGKIDPQCLDKFVETAEKCLAYECTDRPSMEDVLSDLEHALQLQESAEASLAATMSAGLGKLAWPRGLW